MDVTWLTVLVAVAGLLLMALLGGLQLVAVVRPRADWTVENVYGGSPDATDPKAYFAFNRGWAWADAVFWAPVHMVGCVAMLFGQRWGFLLALVGSVPFWYSAVPLFVWDRDLGFRGRHWFVTWSMFPLYGVIAGGYCFVRLLQA